MTQDEFYGRTDLPENARLYLVDPLTSQTQASTTRYVATFEGKRYKSGPRQWATPPQGMEKLILAGRVALRGNSIGYVRFLGDFPFKTVGNIWSDISGSIQSRSDPKVYVVQTSTTVIQRCVLMATDPGDLVLDPTCGSGRQPASPSSGAGDGSRSTPAEWHSHWLALG